METKEQKIEQGLDQFLENEPTKKTVVKTKTGLVEKVEVDKKLVVEDGREILREITYNRY